MLQTSATSNSISTYVAGRLAVLTIVARSMAGRYNQKGGISLKYVLLLPRKDWFVMIAVALSVTLKPPPQS
jgi:hypothetical protein